MREGKQVGPEALQRARQRQPQPAGASTPCGAHLALLLRLGARRRQLPLQASHLRGRRMIRCQAGERPSESVRKQAASIASHASCRMGPLLPSPQWPVRRLHTPQTLPPPTHLGLEVRGVRAHHLRGLHLLLQLRRPRLRRRQLGAHALLRGVRLLGQLAGGGGGALRADNLRGRGWGQGAQRSAGVGDVGSRMLCAVPTSLTLPPPPRRPPKLPAPP